MRADILADADAKRLAVLAEVERLSRGRDALLRDLERLQHVLSQATSPELVALPAPAEPPEPRDVAELLVEMAG
jgi:hypothetical protein